MGVLPTVRAPQEERVRWQGTIHGECCSMKNSRRLVTTGRGRNARHRVIKSAKALAWVEAAERELAASPLPARPLEGRLRLTAWIYYRSERPDLDESLVLDVLQGWVMKNDRQVREKHIFHRIDRHQPRAELLVEEIGE